MKKTLKLFIGIIAVASASLMISCEGPEGPAGADANGFCTECHSDAGMESLGEAFELSGHYAAGAVGYAGGRSSCARCHSNEGFLNYLAATPGKDLVNIEYPTRISCGTCHGNHESLEEGLTVPLRVSDAVIAIEDSAKLDLEGSSNLCGNCHQSRRGYAYYEAVDSIDTDGDRVDDLAIVDGNVGINSSHAGPHHGPQIQVLLGLGGKGTSVKNSSHASAGCVGCHMGEENSHDFKPVVANCTSCHSDATDLDVGGWQTEVETRMAAIAAKLVEEGALSGDATEGYHPHVSSVSQDVFDAFWNYMYVYEDHSHGVHNPEYTENLLSDAESKLGL